MSDDMKTPVLHRTAQSEIEVSNLSPDVQDFVDDENSPEHYDDMMREFTRAADPDYLKITTMADLYDNVYPERKPVVEDMLYYGTSILGGASKVGKSFFSLQLAYCVSQGILFLEHNTTQMGVLYFALEDNEERLQHRLYKMFGSEAVDHLYFATNASCVGSGFAEQLRTAKTEHPDIGLVIIDVLQRIRNPDEISTYAADYAFIGLLKQLAEQYHICLLLVHHTRKMKDDDVFNMISGSTGIIGAADSALVLYKEKRNDDFAILKVTGREQADSTIIMTRAGETLQWEYKGMETEARTPPPDEVLCAISRILSEDKPLWIGSAEDLIGQTGIPLKANALSRHLNINAARLHREYHIRFAKGKTHAGRCIRLLLEVPNQEDNGKESGKA